MLWWVGRVVMQRLAKPWSLGAHRFESYTHRILELARGSLFFVKFDFMSKEFGIKESGINYMERVGSYGIAIRDGSVLIEKARLGYFLPGGGVEKDETLENTLVREFLEETGYELASYKSLVKAVEYVAVPTKSLYLKKINHFYIVETGSKTKPHYPDGHEYPVEWVPFDKVKGKMVLQS